ncbi:MAG: LptF/LptG family permease [Candidatus Palauibacterales bacterium]|nr:LptF/LptG family permease [Candidatus Palauibacterales bacterium]MDP2529205.1 LptF/LptG family permease [Candidatus Palauibacterales bacterium]MDP2584006.1 LptF/LptG family permease [Candidatus Palauibacterales bacterium]
MPGSPRRARARLPESEPRSARPGGILTRYLLRLHAAPFLFALSALTLLLLLNEIGQRFNKLLGKGLDWTIIARVFVLSLPFILAVTVPMAVLIAVLYTFNQLAADNEITALKASGIHLPRLLAPLALAGLLIGGALVVFNNTLLPASNHRLALLLSSIGRKKPTFVLRERTINEVLANELYLQAARIDRARSALQDVAIYDRRTRDRARTIYADSGDMAYNKTQTDLFLTLYNGIMYQHSENKPREFERMDFRELVMRVPGVTNQLEKEQENGYRGDREMPVGRMEKEVRSARLEQAEVLAQSRAFSEGLALRILGLPVPRDTVPSRPAASRPGAAPPGAAGDTGETSAARDTQETGAARDTGTGKATTSVPDTGPLAAVSGSDTAFVRDSTLAVARRKGHDNAARLNALVSAATEAGSYTIRLRGAKQRASRYQVEIQKKFAIPTACLVFVLIGGPIAVRYKEGGVAMVVAVSLVVFCAYYVSLVAGEGLADRLIISPYVAMWSPDVLFGAIGLWFVWRGVRVG